MALFGSGKRLAALKGRPVDPSQMMPGVVSGYGGGTFNMDGTHVTPTTGADGSVMQVEPAAVLAQSGTQNGKAEAGYAIRAALPPTNAERGETTTASPSIPQPQPLGGSMRQPFDYDAAMQRLVGDKPKQSPWAVAAAIIGDALMSSSGGRPFAVQNLIARRQGYQDRRAEATRMLTDWQYKDYARQNEADLKAAAPFTIGRDRVQYNPANGMAEVLFDGPEDFELYASELGLEPGTDDYFRAVEDYVLRSSGPSAHTRDLALDDYRTGNDVRMEGLRFGNRQRMEGLRQSNRLETIRSRPAPVGRGGGRSQAGQGGESLPVVSSPAEASRLPKGTRFRTPDGRVKVVP